MGALKNLARDYSVSQREFSKEINSNSKAALHEIHLTRIFILKIVAFFFQRAHGAYFFLLRDALACQIISLYTADTRRDFVQFYNLSSPYNIFLGVNYSG